MKKTLMSIFIIILLLILTRINLYAAISAKDIVKKVKKSYEKYNNIAVEFKQIFKWQLAGSSKETKGKLYIKDKIKYRIEMPDQVIVTDGKTVWQYSITNNQVLIDDMKKKDEEQLPSKMLFRYSEEYRPEIVGNELFDGIPCFVLQLTSKTGDNYIQQMKIWIDKATWLTRKIEHEDINGNLNTYIIQAITTNINLEESRFKFTAPEGVEEVDLRVK